MGKKNIVFNDYISRNDRFADIYNGIVFKGKQVIHPQNLTTLDSKIWRRKQEKHSYHEYLRDHAKIWEYKGIKFVLGLEPEESLHFALPVKYMNYESIQYDNEYKNIAQEHRKNRDLPQEEYLSGFARTDTLMPVITLGIYLGKEKWSGATKLKQNLNWDRVPREIYRDLYPYCNDFHVNLLDINELKSSDIFVSDLREVLGFLMRQNNKRELIKFVHDNENFRHLEEDAYEVIAAYSASKELSMCKEEFRTEEGFDMCVAIEELIEDGRSEGRVEGRAEVNRLIWSLLQDGREEELLESAKDEKMQRRLMREYGI